MKNPRSSWKVLEGPERFRKVFEKYRKFPDVPRRSQKCPEVRGRSRKFLEVSGCSWKVPEVPEKTWKVPEVPGNSKKFPEGPGMPGPSGNFLQNFREFFCRILQNWAVGMIVRPEEPEFGTSQKYSLLLAARVPVSQTGLTPSLREFLIHPRLTLIWLSSPVSPNAAGSPGLATKPTR